MSNGKTNGKPNAAQWAEGAGAVALLRWMQTAAAAGGAFAPTTGEEARLLALLRARYGATEQNANGAWRLRYAPQWLNAARLQEALGAPVELLDEVASTNARAKELQKAGKAPPFFVFAQHQYGGRGQRGKSWLSLPADAVVATAALPAPPSVEGLSVAVGAELWRQLGAPAALRLRWPNDLLDANNNKVGGILVEVAAGAAFVGIGINRNMPPALAEQINAMGGWQAGGLLACLPAPPPPREALALAAATAARLAVAGVAAGGFVDYRDLAIAAHGLRLGERLPSPQGEGDVFWGFAADGALLTQPPPPAAQTPQQQQQGGASSAGWQ